MKAAIYLRVSTVNQAEKDISIPDQRRTARGFCEQRDWTVVEEYVEPGKSAKDDNRPTFQRMVMDALTPSHPFDVIVVHSYSRFSRDEIVQETYIRRLEAKGVTVLSCTEQTGDGIMGEFGRRFIGLVAEIENKQRTARVRQTMLENARQGFWNGGRPPYGYRLVTAETRGSTDKKRLEIVASEAETVRLMFRLARHGDGDGPLGIKAIVNHLNASGIRYRTGREFRIKDVHRVLRASTYMGMYHYRLKPVGPVRADAKEEAATITVPAIIEPDEFDAVQRLLDSRRPTVTPARISNGAMLLTRIATCPHCGGGMSLSTGKSGRYAYYACSNKATKGDCKCTGRRIPRDLLDGIVLNALEQRILQPERLGTILSELGKRLLAQQGQSLEEEKRLRQEQRAVEAKIARLYDALESGLTDDDDTFRDRLSKHKQRREQLLHLIGHSRRRRELPRDFLSKKNLSRFAAAMRDRLRGDSPALRRAYVRLLVDRVVVGEERIEIRGSKRALMAALEGGDNAATGAVPTSVQEWRRGRDSNPR